MFHPAGSSDAPGEPYVQLTWYGAKPQQWIRLTEFIRNVVNNGTIEWPRRAGGQRRHDQHGEHWGEDGRIDTVTLDGTTWDFGAGKPEGPIEGHPEHPIEPTDPVDPPARSADQGRLQERRLEGSEGRGWNDFKNQGQCVAYFSR